MSRRLKIFHIISPQKSGVDNELAEFAARLSPDEFEVEICVLAGKNHFGSSQTIFNVPTTTLGLRWSFDIGTYLGVRKIIRRFCPDVVHTWDTDAQLYGILHSGKQRVIAEKRNTEAPTGKLQRYLDKKTHRLITPRKTLDGTQTVVIPPAAVPVQHTAPLSAKELLEKMDIPLVEVLGDYFPVFQPQYDPERRNYKPMPPHAEPFLIGVVLPLCSEHRILDALWVFETFNHIHLNYHAFVIGDGRDQEQFLRYRDRWKLFSRVHFLGNVSNVCRLLPSFDALLHLSSSADHSGTILSAMWCGVPVVALETPESREYIVDGTTGFLIPSKGDGEGASRFYRRTSTKRLLSLLENDGLRLAMQKAGKDRVAKEFCFDTAVHRRIDLYRDRNPAVR